MVVNTWLPVFPGFYETPFSYDKELYDKEEGINAERAEKGLPPLSELETDWEDFEREVAEACVEILDEWFVNNGFVYDIKFEGVHSPREYNYMNDIVNIQIVLEDSNLEKIKNYIERNLEKFSEFLEEEYTARDGFIPWYSNKAEDWTGEAFNDTVEDEHKLGALLNFIILSSEDLLSDSAHLADLVWDKIGRFSPSVLDEDEARGCYPYMECRECGQPLKVYKEPDNVTDYQIEPCGCLADKVLFILENTYRNNPEILKEIDFVRVTENIARNRKE